MRWADVTGIGIACGTLLGVVLLLSQCTVENVRSARAAAVDQARIEAAEKHQFRKDLLTLSREESKSHD